MERTATVTAWSAVSDLLPQAMGIALSPMPIVALIVLLTLPGGRPRGLGFALGGLAGLILAGTALTFASGPAPGQDAAAPSATSSVVKLALGLFMWAFAYRTWKHRDDGGQPGWMTTLETLGFGKAFLFGAGMMVVNPKNLPILGAAALSVSGAGLQGGAQLWAMAIFGVAAGITLLVPALLALVLGERMDPALQAVGDWLTEHNAAIMMVLFAILGANMIGKGLTGLFGR